MFFQNIILLRAREATIPNKHYLLLYGSLAFGNRNKFLEEKLGLKGFFQNQILTTLSTSKRKNFIQQKHILYYIGHWCFATERNLTRKNSV